MRRLMLTTALALCALPALAREKQAIPVGASTCPGLKQQYWLKGPANDVALVQTCLTTAAPVPFDAGNVTVLADGIKRAPAPTLAVIRGAFADLTTRVPPGGFRRSPRLGPWHAGPGGEPGVRAGRAGRVVPAGGHRRVVRRLGRCRERAGR